MTTSSTFHFSPPVEAMLRRAGWLPGRVFDTTAFRHYAALHEFPYHEAADQFFREFGGLDIDMGKVGEQLEDEYVFLDPVEVIEMSDLSDRLESALNTSRLIGKSVVLLGVLSNDFDLYMDNDGAVYGQYASPQLVGPNGHEALQRLLSRAGRPYPVIA